MGKRRTVHVRTSGRVQGVGFRYWVHSTSRQLGLSGWVRNRLDGTVEAVFQGDCVSVSDMLRRCKSGPTTARVENVDVLGAPDGRYDSFEFYPTQ